MKTKQTIIKDANTIVVIKTLQKNVKVKYYSARTNHLLGEHIRKKTTFEKVIYEFTEVYGFKIILSLEE